MVNPSLARRRVSRQHCLQPPLHQFDVGPCGLDAGLRLLLESVQNMNETRYPNCVDGAKRVAL